MPNYLAALSLVSLFFILVISTALILWENYDDGIFGKVVLILLAVASWAALDRMIPFSEYTYQSQVEAWFHVAVAAWLMRHFYRFLCFQYDGRYAWLRKPEKCE